MDNDNNLIKKYVSTFLKYDRDFTDIQDVDRRSHIIEFAVPEVLLEKIEVDLPAKFPHLFRILILNYRYDVVELDGYSLLANPVGDNLSAFRQEIFRDKYLWSTLIKNKFIQFGRGEKYTDYDPVCFDINNNMEIVKLDHEEILCNAKIKIVKKLAGSFKELVENTISKVNSI